MVVIPAAFLFLPILRFGFREFAPRVFLDFGLPPRFFLSSSVFPFDSAAFVFLDFHLIHVGAKKKKRKKKWKRKKKREEED